MPTTSKSKTSARRAMPEGPSLRLCVSDNPKKPGSAAHARFAAMMTAATDGVVSIEAALSAGYTRADLAHDRGKGFVESE